MPRVTVVIALYNKSNYIKRALDSVFNQRFEDVEVIVVDDGSTDDGVQVVESYTDPRVKLIRQDNAGPGAARNTGLDNVQSHYVCFLDADDEYLDGFFAETIGFLESNAECFGVSVGTVNELDEYYEHEKLDRLALQDGINRLTPDYEPSKLTTLLNIRGHCTWLYRTAIVKSIGGYPTNSKYGEDQYMVMQLLIQGPFGVIKKPFHKYHTELSELCGKDISQKPPMPFLTDPELLYERCPEELHGLLDRFLELRASGFAIRTMQSINPNRSLAKRFLKQFPYVGGDLVERAKAWVWCYLASIIKTVKRCKRC